MKKYSNSFNRDWLFLIANMRKFIFSGVDIIKFPHSLHGVDAKRAFQAYDSEGIISRTKHPKVVGMAINCKKSINFHLKLWAEGYNDCLIGRDEYLKEFLGAVPEWVNDSFVNQRFKHYKK